MGSSSSLDLSAPSSASLPELDDDQLPKGDDSNIVFDSIDDPTNILNAPPKETSTLDTVSNHAGRTTKVKDNKLTEWNDLGTALAETGLQAILLSKNGDISEKQVQDIVDLPREIRKGLVIEGDSIYINMIRERLKLKRVLGFRNTKLLANGPTNGYQITTVERKPEKMARDLSKQLGLLRGELEGVRVREGQGKESSKVRVRVDSIDHMTAQMKVKLIKLIDRYEDIIDFTDTDEQVKGKIDNLLRRYRQHTSEKSQKGAEGGSETDTQARRRVPKRTASKTNSSSLSALKQRLSTLSNGKPLPVRIKSARGITPQIKRFLEEESKVKLNINPDIQDEWDAISAPDDQDTPKQAADVVVPPASDRNSQSSNTKSDDEFAREARREVAGELKPERKGFLKRWFSRSGK